MIICVAATIALQVAGPSYLADVNEAMRRTWPTNRTVTIVCHGHSVPAGYGATPQVRSLDAYPNLLRERLAAGYPNAVINVIVTAVGGENSESGAARFSRDVLPLRPDVVTIDYALNDRGIGLARAKAAWSSMIEMARSRGVKVLLVTPTPDQGAALGDPNDPLSKHAAQVRELAAAYHVGLVDATAEFEAAVTGGTALKELMAQSNHPNRQGHALVLRRLAPWFGL